MGTSEAHVRESRLPEPVDVVVDEARIATYVLDPERGTPAGDVVFCHGTPWSAQVWAEAARHLGNGYRVFLWDMPGYGRSAQDPEVQVDLASQMSRLAALLAHWGLDRPHVVAHDIGGAVALGAHLLHGREYAGLFLWDVVTLEPWGSPFFRLVAEHGDVFAQLPAALHAALVREYIAGAGRHQLTAGWLDTLTGPWLGATGQTAFYRQIAALRVEHTRPVVARLGQVRCPVAIGWGERDPWIPLEQATRLRDLLPGQPSVLTLADVGHLAPVEASAPVSRALDDWLGGSMARDG
ncbi:alpha/beta fold hydrolase [Myceligenerans pegani]|uniref:Alpha/beta hydrolase n=1 Tax=Myceligenerans pegani TaxID=2776917 RepID=A0ABR9N5A0_9MICO|nr:alpha/beta hydrolase [Myceligenerans sp. TRM 65318]MBE1878847.1 alpha/beta hydrolase [Myceligenerans sp. TRM 65318]MBE3021118.1 alpha/beta hydrolase [Myceligenerans sp. TRM 65318]